MAGRERIFRVFVSSTFSDFVAERNALQAEVFPRLRALCADRGARFQPIDLRWGVSEEAAHDQRTLDICLEEVRRSQAVSPRPNFIVLLGDRYGWRPLPRTIPAADFAALAGHMAPEDRALCLDWYRRDDNAVPALQVLRPRTGGLAAAQDWETTEARLRTALVDAAARLGWSDEERSIFEASATEHEIVSGLLRTQDADRHVFAYLRQAGAPDEATHGAGPVGPGVGDDADEQDRLVRLRRTLASALGEHVRPYAAQRGSSGPQMADMARFCRDVLEDLSGIISAELDALDDIAAVAAEEAAQVSFAEGRTRHFVGRDAELARLLAYAHPGSPGHGAEPARPLFVTGEGGCGKSALLARVADLVAGEGTVAVIARYVGATAGSTQLQGLLGGLCTRIFETCGLAEQRDRRLRAVAETSRDAQTERDRIAADYAIGSDAPAAAASFLRFLGLVPADRPVLILIDGLDQLVDEGSGPPLAWWPTLLPDHVRVVLSSAQDGGAAQAQAEKGVLRLGPFPRAMASRHLAGLLASAGRQLQPSQWLAVDAALDACRLPLFVRLLFETVRHWSSTDVPGLLPTSAPDLFRAFLVRLQADANHGPVLVAHALGFLRAARFGLAEDELLDLLSEDCDPAVLADHRRRSPRSPAIGHIPTAVWSRLLSDLEPYLAWKLAAGTRVLTFFHRILGEVVEEAFLAGDGGRAIRVTAARYFTGQPLSVPGTPAGLNRRKLQEEVHLLRHAGMWGELFDVLTDLGRLDRLARAAPEPGGDGGLAAFRDDLRSTIAAWPPPDAPGPVATPHRQALEAFDAILGENAEDFAARPDLLAPQIHNRLSGSAGVLAQTLARQATRWTEGRVWLESAAPLPPPLLRSALRCTPWGRADVGPVMADRLCLVAGQAGASFQYLSSTHTVSLLDLDRARLVRQWADPGRTLIHCVLGEDGSRMLAVSDTGDVRVWDTATGDLRGFHALGQPVSILASDPAARRIVVAGAAGAWALDIRGPTADVLDPGPAVVAAAVSANGSRAAFGHESGDVVVVDLDTGRAVVSRRLAEAPLGLLLSPDGRTLAMSLRGDRVGAWSTDGLAPLWECGTVESPWRRLCFSPDSSLLLAGPEKTERAGTASAGPVLSAREARTGHVVSRFEGHDGTVHDVAFSPDGTRLATASADGTLKLWKVPDGALLRTLGSHAGSVVAVRFRSTGEIVSSGDDGIVRTWVVDDAGGRPASHAPETTACAAWAAGPYAFSGGSEGTVRRWTLRSGEATGAVVAHAGAVAGLTAGLEAPTLLSFGADGVLAEIGIDPFVPLRRFTGHDGPVTAGALSPDGRLLASGGADGTARIWDRATASCRATLPGHAGPVSACLFIEGGAALVTADETGGQIRIWECATGALRQTLGTEAARTRASRSAMSASLGMAVAMGAMSMDDVMGQFEAHDATLGPSHEAGVDAMAVTRDGSRAASLARVGEPIVWDLATGLEVPGIRSMETGYKTGPPPARAHDRCAGRLAIGGDGGHLAWISAIGEAHLWAMRKPGGGVRTVGRGVSTLAMAPGGRWLALGGRGGLVVIHDLDAGSDVAALVLPAGVTAIAWGTGAVLLCGDRAGCVHVLHLRGVGDP